MTQYDRRTKLTRSRAIPVPPHCVIVLWYSDLTSGRQAKHLTKGSLKRQTRDPDGYGCRLGQNRTDDRTRT